MELPFEHPDVRVIVDSMFLDGLLHPLAVRGALPMIPEWAKVGIIKDPLALRNLVEEGIDVALRVRPTLEDSGSLATLEASCLVSANRIYGIGVRNSGRVVLTDSVVRENTQNGLFAEAGGQAVAVDDHVRRRDAERHQCAAHPIIQCAAQVCQKDRQHILVHQRRGERLGGSHPDLGSGLHGDVPVCDAHCLGTDGVHDAPDGRTFAPAFLHRR